MSDVSPPYYVLEAAKFDQKRVAVWKSYIDKQMAAFSAYDAQRPVGHPYPFDVHSERVAKLMQLLALDLGWSQDIAALLQLATRPHDIGKMALPVEIWDSKDKPTNDEKALRRTHVEEGLTIMRRDFTAEQLKHPFAMLVLNIMENHHETLNESGLFGKNSEGLDVIARMVCICDAFDGYSVKRPHFGDRDISIQSVIMRMRDEKRGQFDDDLLSVFAKMMEQHYDQAKNFVDQYHN